MLFNSFNFVIFLPVVFLLYWFVANQSIRAQNILLLVASYFFYACWDWRFLFLLIFSTVLDYLTGLQMEDAKSQNIKKFWFWLSICVNLGFLGFFKYYNFFVSSFADAASEVGFKVNPLTIGIILPIGISFYTFHGLSYVIDIYKNRIKAEKSFIDYAVFVSFFPLLVAGPIERATHLLPQIQSKRTFDYQKAILGLRQILWGLFKKIVIADQCSQYADQVFNNSSDYSGFSLILGAIFFAFQIYGDFSGYSDIALGTARLFGIDLLRNFAYPYFSRDIAEFWRRWHISLSSWFRDYLYIPLGGSRGGMWMKIRNTFIIFLVSGFWHGANWTFIIWGFLNALYIMPSIVRSTHRDNLNIVAQGRLLPSFKETLEIITTFGLTVFAWIFFRASNVTHAFDFLYRIFSGIATKASFYQSYVLLFRVGYVYLAVILLFFFVEWLGREQQFAIASIGTKWKKPLRYGLYYAIIIAIFSYSADKQQQFIYFQF